MNSSIPYNQVIHEMDKIDDEGKSVPFNLKYVTADRNRREGGEIITAENVIKCVGKKNGEVIIDNKQVPREPNHREHGTRNILFPNGQIRKLHTRLIIEFNGKKVIP